ncbi:MAG: hypothetical protein KJI72_00650 [Patescibacteria group bacterium]|nr:hypothetical protein [Patescibacteria group bacterium]
MKRNLIISIVIVIVLLVVGVIFIFQSQQDSFSSDFDDRERGVEENNIGEITEGRQVIENKNCENFEFTEYFVDPIHIQKVTQIGGVHGSGKYTVGRVYIDLNKNSTEKVPIYAPTEMVLTYGSRYYPDLVTGKEGYLPDYASSPDYALSFDAGCGVTMSFSHLKEVVDSVAQQLPEVKSDSRGAQLDPIKFEAGDLIAYFIQDSAGPGIDFIVHDINVVNQFANQERQEAGRGSNLLHAVCPYDFYSGEKKEAYYNLIGGGGGTLFEVQECGPVSRDFPGTISGQWFLDKEVLTSFYEYYQDGDYGSVLPIVGDEERITIGRLGDKNTHWIYPNNPTYKDLKDVTNNHCYQFYPNFGDAEGWVYFKLIDDETMDVVYSSSGICPNSFPEGQGKRYYR